MDNQVVDRFCIYCGSKIEECACGHGAQQSIQQVAQQPIQQPAEQPLQQNPYLTTGNDTVGTTEDKGKNITGFVVACSVVVILVSVFCGALIYFSQQDSGSGSPSNKSSGDISSLTYEMKEESFEAYNSYGELFYTSTVSYPYFSSECETAKLLNDRYDEYLSELRSKYDQDSNGLDNWYEEAGCGEAMSLPLFENLEATVKYNENGYVSIYENKPMFTGGYKGYLEYEALNYKIDTAEEIGCGDAIDGDSDEDKEVILYNIYDDRNYYDMNLFENINSTTDYNFTQGGIVYYMFAGDSFAPDEFTIGYNQTDSPIISAEEVLHPEVSDEVTAQEAEKLWKAANLQYNIWKYAVDAGYTYSDEYMEHVRIIHGSIKSTYELEEHLGNYFDSTICRELIDNYYYFTDSDGNLCCSGFAEPHWDDDTFISVSVNNQGTDYMTITAEFTDDGYYGYSEYELEKVDDRWIFTGYFEPDYNNLT